MTITTTTQRIAYTGTGADTVLSVPYKFYATTDLVVTKRTTATGAETTLTEGTHYTVLGGNGATGRDRKSTRLNSSHSQQSRMPSSA